MTTENQAPEGEPSDAAVELAAKAVYRLFIGADDHPWVEGGNSLKQCDARRYARAALAAQPLPTRSQRMREAGYTRRPSWKSLPSDADDVQQDGWNEPYNCIAAGPTATDVALHQAMNEAAKVGNRDDDKLIRKALNDAGYYLVRSMKKPGTCEHMLAVPDVQAPAEGDGAAPHNVIALPPLPTGDRERVYAGHGNEDVVETFSATQMREYARQAVHEAEEAWQSRANVQPKGPVLSAKEWTARQGVVWSDERMAGWDACVAQSTTQAPAPAPELPQLDPAQERAAVEGAFRECWTAEQFYTLPKGVQKLVWIGFVQGFLKGQVRPQAPAVGAPTGYVLLPVEPTPEMWAAARAVPEPVKPYPPHYALIWDAMLKAAPKPPVQGKEQP